MSNSESNNLALEQLEILVLQGISSGKTIQEIAFQQSLKIENVENLRQSLMQKLQIYTHAELTKYALQKKLISDEI